MTVKRAVAQTFRCYHTGIALLVWNGDWGQEPISEAWSNEWKRDLIREAAEWSSEIRYFLGVKNELEVAR